MSRPIDDQTKDHLSFQEWERLAIEYFERFGMDRLYAWADEGDARDGYNDGIAYSEFARQIRTLAVRETADADE